MVIVACGVAVVLPGLGVWVMVRVGVLGARVSRVVAAAAPASKTASLGSCWRALFRDHGC